MTKSKETPKGALDAMLYCHKKFYIGRKEDLMPMYWLWRQNGEMVPCLIAQMPRETDIRNLIVAKVKEQVAAFGDVYMFAFVSEGWTVPPMTEAEYRKMKVTPSQSDNRIEVVNTLIGHRDGTRLMEVQELVRDWKTGCVTELRQLHPTTEMKAGDSPHVYSRFDLFAESGN